LDAVAVPAAQERGTLVPIDARQRRQDVFTIVSGVSVGAFGACARRPDARDHRFASCGVTTVHSRISTFLTSPFLVFGSASTNRSATERSGPLKISSARSTGSANAPARTISPR